LIDHLNLILNPLSMPRHLTRINCSGLSITFILLSVISSYSASAQSDFGIGVAYSIQFGGPAVSVRYPAFP